MMKDLIFYLLSCAIFGACVAADAQKRVSPAPFALPTGTTVMAKDDSGKTWRQNGVVTGAVQTVQAAERLDVNTASAEALERLPEIGPALAERIVADRANE